MKKGEKAIGWKEKEGEFTLHRVVMKASLGGYHLGRGWKKPAKQRSGHQEQQVQRSWGKRTRNLLIISLCVALSYHQQRYPVIWAIAIMCFFVLITYVFIDLTVLGLSCSMWDLVPWPGIEPVPPPWGAWSLSHWTTREVLPSCVYNQISECVCVCVCVCTCTRSVMSDSLWSIDCNLPGSSVHEFSRQEYWSGLTFPSSADLPNPGIEPSSPALADSLPLSHKESLNIIITNS